MKKKRKAEVCSNSDSDNNENFSSFQKNSSQSTNSPKKKPRRELGNNYKDQDEHQKNESKVQVFENESSNESTSSEIDNTLDSINSIFSIEELTSDDEIYTFQCPENYIKQNLCDKIMDFTKLNQTITCNNEVFQLQVQNLEKKFITLAVPKKTSGGSLIKMPLKGHIIIRKVVDIPAGGIKSENENEMCDEVIFPDNIKVRHPLLGVEWKAHVDLAAEVIKKENYFKKKKKKTKDKSLEIEENNFKKIKKESFENNNFDIQKKKKRNSNY